MSALFDKTTEALGTSLDMRLLRQNVTSANIANAETPGYKARKLDFEDALARAINLEGKNRVDTTHPEHVPVGLAKISRMRADVYENPDVDTANDGNTVDMEREMAVLAENSVLYRAAVQLINKKLAAMRYAVTEGTR